MPTPTPAKPNTSPPPRIASIVAFAAAIGVAVYLLRPQAPAADDHERERALVAQRAAEAPQPAGPQRDEAERTAGDPSAPAPAASAPHVAAPSIEELEGELAAHPDQVLRRLADALPRGERDAQRLTLLEVRALVARGQIGTARAKAHGYFERWPGGPDTAVLEQLTGAHPTADAVGR